MRNSYVPARGNPAARIAIVGEQPGYTEIRWKPPTPFVGAAGEVLDSCLQLAGITRRECWLTNVIKDLDRPLATYINIDGDNSTITANGQEYINQLRDELTQLKPNIAIALGNVALLALCSRTGITKWRGSILESTLVYGLKVIPSFHPATVIPPKSNYTNKPLITFDLKRALKESKFPEIRRLTRNIEIKPSFDKAIATLRWLYQRGLEGNILDFDIEVINEELDCFAFAWSPYESMCIPLRYQGDYFPIEQELEIMKWVATILEDPHIAIRGANIIFDLQFMMKKYGICTHGDIHCTQIAQKILTPDYPAGLDFVTTTHTDLPYYKQDGKKWIKMGVGSWETWWTYNGMDSIATADAHPKQIIDLESQGNIEVYDRQRKVIPPLLYMATRGIRVDVQGIIAQKEKETLECEQLTEQFKSIVGYDINPNSPQQMADYFYKKLGHAPYKKRTAKGWVVTTDVDAIKRLARKGIEAARILLRLRKLSKRIGTYLNIKKIDPDGRMRSSYKPVGAETGRIASGETIFGGGCMPPNAECLTKSGWKTLHDLSNKPEEIMQWNPNGELSWDLPSINVYPFQGMMISADSNVHRGLYTPNHRIPTISKRGVLKDHQALEVMNKSNWFLPLSGVYKSGAFDLPTTKLLAIIQADGSIEGNGVRFSFSKQRKIDRFLSIMDEYNISYTEQSADPGFRRFYIPVDVAKPYVNILMSGGDKSFGSWIFMLNQETLKILLEEIKYWDSYIRGDSFIYYTVKKKNAEWVATLAHLVGKSANITEVVNNKYEGSYGDESLIYNVNIKPRDKAHQHEDMYSEQYYNWFVYCPTVSTSYFLCRYKDKIFVTGNSNQQNWPHDLLQYFLFDEGYIGYSFDLSQAENRIVAYVGGIVQMIEAFEKGIDLHRLTAALIFSKALEDVSDEEGSSDLGDGTHSERFWGKKGNHSLNYDFGYKSFALKYEISESESKWIVDQYHRAYPGVRQNYHAMVINLLRATRTLENCYGRKRLFMGPVIPNPPSVPSAACHQTYKEAYAQIPQSTVADKINEDGVEYIYYNDDPLFHPIEQLTQIHDSIVFQIPVSIPWIDHARVLTLIKQSLEKTIHWHGSPVPIPADLTIGVNMFKDQSKELKSKYFPSDINQLAQNLATYYDELKRK